MTERDTISTEILALLAPGGRGRIFFADEFYDRWPDSSVRYTLSAMARDGQIVRLARGVFCYPRLSEHGMKMILPDRDAIANAIAGHTRVRIVPCGDQAAFLVGLTSLQLASATYLTDGAPRLIRLASRRTIEFRHTSEMRTFAFSDHRMQLICAAVRAVGRDGIRIQERETLKWKLSDVPDASFVADLPLCPGWVRELLLDLRG